MQVYRGTLNEDLRTHRVFGAGFCLPSTSGCSSVDSLPLTNHTTTGGAQGRTSSVGRLAACCLLLAACCCCASPLLKSVRALTVMLPPWAYIRCCCLLLLPVCGWLCSTPRDSGCLLLAAAAAAQQLVSSYYSVQATPPQLHRLSPPLCLIHNNGVRAATSPDFPREGDTRG